MKRAAPTIAAAALWGALATCGGGTLGGNSGAGSTGVIGPPNPAGAPGRGGAGGGSGASGWEFGVGGSIGPTCPPEPVPACGSACGNGAIDACPSTAPQGCPTANWREQCDGADFGGDSCVQRGYGSGELTCQSDCTLGVDTCSPCVPADALVASCKPGPTISEYFGPHAMAATDTEVALAVLRFGEFGNQSVLFQRLAPDLSLLGSTVLDDADLPIAQEGLIFGTALAPLPAGGWAVAFCAQPDVYIQTLDAAGRVRARVVVSPSVDGSVCNAQVPVLAARPNGGPLMLWQDDGVMMSVIAADGMSASQPQMIAGADAITWDNPTAAWVGNEFAIAIPITIDTNYGIRTLRLLRVAPDGTPSVVGEILSGEVEGFATIAEGQDARDVRIVYTGVPTGGDFNTDYGLIWSRLDPAGPTRSTLIAAPPGDVYRPASALAFGDDTVIFASRGYGQAYGITRVGADGRVVSPYRDVIRSPGYGGTAVMVRRGPELVVGVAITQTIYLARLTP